MLGISIKIILKCRRIRRLIGLGVKKKVSKVYIS